MGQFVQHLLCQAVFVPVALRCGGQQDVLQGAHSLLHTSAAVGFLSCSERLISDSAKPGAGIKYFLIMFLHDDTGFFPLPSGKCRARKSSTGITEKNAPKSSPIPTWRSHHLVDKLDAKGWWDSIILHVPRGWVLLRPLSPSAADSG